MAMQQSLYAQKQATYPSLTKQKVNHFHFSLNSFLHPLTLRVKSPIIPVHKHWEAVKRQLDLSLRSLKTKQR